MVTRADRIWDRSNRQCLICDEPFTPVRREQKICSPPKRCRFTKKAKLIYSARLKAEQGICTVCESEYSPRAANQIICGSECPGKPPLIKTCKHAFCGIKFTVTRQVSPGRQVFCSDACRTKEEVFRKYSITSHTYFEMLDNQNGLCLGCKEPPDEIERLHIHHNHNCCPPNKSCGDCVIGLLHRDCNTVEGIFKDKPEQLLKLAQFLLAQNENTPLS